MVALCGSGSRRRDAVNGMIQVQIFRKIIPENLVVHQNRILLNRGENGLTFVCDLLRT